MSSLSPLVETFSLHVLSFSLLTFLFLIFLIKWLFLNPSSSKNLPPSPPKLPIIGNFHQLGFLPHRSLLPLSQRHGPLMLLHLGTVPTLIVSSADAAREIMKTNDLIFANRPKSHVAEKLLYNSKDVSVAPYGEYWRQLKSICVLQLLSNRRVQSFAALREEETALMMKKIGDLSSSTPVDLSEMFTSITNDVVCRVAFGRKYSEGESGKRVRELLRELLVLLGSLNFGDFFPWLSWINRINGFDSKLDKVAKEIDDFLEGVLQDHMDRLEMESGRKKVHGEGREDFVDTLLKIQKEDVTGISIDRDSIKAILLVEHTLSLYHFSHYIIANNKLI
ncbi:unnamed protein product [Ilex paraguariensis]|uniref:Uncharacterized protein n=1 Tax=Ilex paraguariensis TaxID=185542 RepID=A0ABC8RK46_9AQUA